MEENKVESTIVTKELDNAIDTASLVDDLCMNNSFSNCVTIPAGNLSASSGALSGSYILSSGTGYSTVSIANTSSYYPKIDIKSLSSENIPEGAVLTVGKDGEVTWSETLPGIEHIVSNPGLSAAFDKLIQAYQEFKMMERLSKPE